MATKKQELLVKYSNIMNEISLKDLTKRELNLFMFLFAKAKNEGANEIQIPLETFIQTLDPEGRYLTSQEKVKQAIRTTYIKTDKLYTVDNDEEFAIFHLMNYAEYRAETGMITYQVNNKFLKILNDFGKNNPFTSFELERFLVLESKHSKNLYRQLMQWKNLGEWSVGIDDFRFRMELSSTYTPRNISSKVIAPAIKELVEKKYFAELKCEPQIARKRGGQIKGYTFYFTECVNDQLPGQVSFSDNASFDAIVENMKPKKAIYKDEGGKTQFRTTSDKKKSTYKGRKYKYDADGMPIIED